MVCQNQSNLVHIQLNRRTGDGGRDRTASKTMLHDHLVKTGGSIAFRLGRSPHHLLHKVGNRNSFADLAAPDKRVGVLLALGQNGYDAHARILPCLLGQHPPPTAVVRGQLECLQCQRCSPSSSCGGGSVGAEIRQHVSDLTPRYAQGRGKLGDGLATILPTTTSTTTITTARRRRRPHNIGVGPENLRNLRPMPGLLGRWQRCHGDGLAGGGR
mmetsp:Transcript_11158/g.31460  ORF Transcript_11158/g.31460 Transcript_11158/m.31460 type:complete len:214 (-) Transcript_11158:15-656(-)